MAANAADVEAGALKGNGAALADARKTAQEYNNGLTANLEAIEAKRRASGDISASTETDPAKKVFGEDVVKAVQALAGAKGLQGLETAAMGEETRGADGKPTAKGAAEIAQGMAAIRGGEIDTLTAAALKAQANGFKDPDTAPSTPTPPAAPIKFESPEAPSAPLPTPGKGGASTTISI